MGDLLTVVMASSVSFCQGDYAVCIVIWGIICEVAWYELEKFRCRNLTLAVVSWTKMKREKYSDGGGGVIIVTS